MIVDDSIIARAVFSRMVENESDLEIAASAGTAEQAIELLKSTDVDVVLLDLEMPGIGGLDALPRIIEAANGAQVLVVSSLTADGAEQTVAALALGAADTLPKPGIGQFNGRFSEVLLGKIRGLGTNDRVRLRRSPKSPLLLRPMPGNPPAVLGIGSSTGGIHALGTFFGELPSIINIPILVTQHLPEAFMAVFARQLATASSRTAVVAEEGMLLLPDRIYVAPGNAHMTVTNHRERMKIKLEMGRSPSGCLPSVDPMFTSLAEQFGDRALGVVLSGIGRDGSEGARRIVAAGGAIIAQNEATSAVWGMPRTVSEAGLASAILAPDQIARGIAALMKTQICK